MGTGMLNDPDSTFLRLDSSLTPLGYHLAQLPVDVRIGKLMILGAVLRYHRNKKKPVIDM